LKSHKEEQRHGLSEREPVQFGCHQFKAGADYLSQDTPVSKFNVFGNVTPKGVGFVGLRCSAQPEGIDHRRIAVPPDGGIAGLLFRNWTANSIFFARSALPTDLVLQYSLYRPNVVSGQPLYLYRSGFPGAKSFNGAAFSIPPNGLDGDLGRNVLHGLDAWQIDFSLHREFRVSEGLSLQLRAEAFNIFNHPNFANPSDGYAFGRLTFAPDLVDREAVKFFAQSQRNCTPKLLFVYPRMGHESANGNDGNQRRHRGCLITVTRYRSFPSGQT
jgi:hypothetical protein